MGDLSVNVQEDRRKLFGRSEYYYEITEKSGFNVQKKRWQENTSQEG